MTKKDNVFKTTFIVSLIFHALLLLPVPVRHLQVSKNEVIPEMIYVALQKDSQPLKKASPAQKTIRQKTAKAKKEMPSAEPMKAEEKKELTPAEKTKVSESVPAAQEKQQQITTKGQISVSRELLNDKNYINYYRLINEQLRQSIVYPRNFSEGEIAVSFVVTSDGKLYSAEVMEDTALNNSSLREAALKIIENAAPFPPFPEELQQSQLTFNIVICFRERG